MPAFHIPGYNYCGPGTWDFTKKPKNKLDKACKAHDLSYQKNYKNKYGVKVHPYFNYTSSDDTLQKEAAKSSGIAAKLVGTVFKIKKLIAPKAYISTKARTPLYYKKKKIRKQRLKKRVPYDRIAAYYL